MADHRKIVGYIRSFNNSQISHDTQKRFIEAYCSDNDIVIDEYFSDMNFRKSRRIEEFSRAAKIGISTKKWTRVFEAWENLMCQIVEGEIGCILVDTKIRLYDGTGQKNALERLCSEYGVTVIEVGDYQPSGSEALPKLTLYHYSIEPDSRTSVALNDVDSLYEFASQRLKGWEATALYLDLNSSNRTQLEKMMINVDCDLILVKNLFHIKRKMMPFLTVAKNLNKRNIRIVSMEEGSLNFVEDKEKEWLSKPLRVAVYDKHRSTYEEENNEIQIDKFKAFVNCCTAGWSIEEVFIDTLESSNQQKKLNNLVKKAKSRCYDIVLVDTFGKIGDTAIWLARIMRQLDIPIISLREGGLELNEQ